MAETGRVTGVKNALLEIEMQRRPECERCGACLSFTNDTTMHLEAVNACKASVGDTVEIYLETNRFFSAVLYLYGIPLVAFLAALLITWLLGASEALSIGISLVFLAISFWVVHCITKRINQTKYLPKAIRIVAHAGQQAPSQTA